MKEDLYKRWIAALRSGNYRQGQMNMKFIDNDGNAFYDALGILCELAGLPYKISQESDGYYYRFSNGSHFAASRVNLPISFAQEIGMRPMGEPYDFSARLSSISSLNDNGRPFSDIADIIEKYREHYIKETV